MALTLQTQLTFVEVDWDIRPLRDSSDDVYRFMEDADVELPKGVMAMATRCYSPSCTGDSRCYAPRCPYKTSPASFLPQPIVQESTLPGQVNRQTIIRQAIQSEIQYEADLTSLETLFMRKLHEVIPFYRLEGFINDVFGNVIELRETSRRVIDNFASRQNQHAVGDIFLEAATDFRLIYPDYTGNVPAAELLIKKELEENPQFRLLNEQVVRENDRRRDIKYLVARPADQLQRYPAVIEAILNATDADDPDRDFLQEALSSIQSLSAISQLKVFHGSRGRGAAGKKQWFDLVPEDQRQDIPKKEQKRQM